MTKEETPISSSTSSSSAAWYSTWFDTPLYEKLYADRDQQEAVDMIRLLEENLPIKDYARVLDLGCGRGRHSLEMAKRGYHVTGLDLSVQALQKARQKAEALGLEITFMRGDMRTSVFTGKGSGFRNSQPLGATNTENLSLQSDRFDVVVNLFTTFGYFSKSEDDQRVLDAVAEMVKDDGWFVLDFLNPEWVRNTLQAEEIRSIDGFTVHIRRWIERNTFDKVRKEMRFTDSEGNLTGEFEESVRMYPLEWFEEQMHGRGFQLERLFGDYQGGNFAAGSGTNIHGQEAPSPRMIQFYQKK